MTMAKDKRVELNLQSDVGKTMEIDAGAFASFFIHSFRIQIN